MASYVVMEPIVGREREDVRFVRDGVSVLALIFPVFWLIWYRLWIEAALVFVGFAAIAAISEWAGWPSLGSLLSLVLAIYVALEGPALRQWALSRRGWREAGVADASDEDEAMLRWFADGHKPSMTDASPQTVPSAPYVASPASSTGPALGLFTYPARR